MNGTSKGGGCIKFQSARSGWEENACTTSSPKLKGGPSLNLVVPDIVGIVDEERSVCRIKYDEARYAAIDGSISGNFCFYSAAADTSWRGNGAAHQIYYGIA